VIVHIASADDGTGHLDRCGVHVMSVAAADRVLAAAYELASAAWTGPSSRDHFVSLFDLPLQDPLWTLREEPAEQGGHETCTAVSPRRPSSDQSDVMSM
jgi:hypothetical protein